MHGISYEEIVDRILRVDPRYAREAYHFVREALDFTQERVHQSARTRATPKNRHVTGQQLLEGIRDYALTTYGPMALYVLGEWGLRSCTDVGEIVFNLVDHSGGMVGKTDQDSRDDFKAGYDFPTAFSQPFQPERNRGKPALEQPHG